MHQTEVFEDIANLGGQYKPAAQGYAISKGIELMESVRQSYDWVIIYRPDILMWEPLILSKYNSSNIYCDNMHGGCAGEIHFIMNQSNAREFGKICESAADYNPPAVHFWIRNYVLKWMKRDFVPDNFLPYLNHVYIWGVALVPDFTNIISQFGANASNFIPHSPERLVQSVPVTAEAGGGLPDCVNSEFV